MTSTFQMVGWDIPESVSEPTLDNASDFVNECSREELGDLLIKVDGILKERENGTSVKLMHSTKNF